MQGGILLAIVIVIGAIGATSATTLGCRESQSDNTPAPPAPPGLAKRVIPAPRGSDDYARRSFASPLSLQDAEAILRHTQIFAFGGMPPKRQVLAFNVLFEQPDAVSQFQRLSETGSSAGKLYALAGLLLLDRKAAGQLQRTLAEEPRKILVFDSDTVYEKPVKELAAIVERRDMGAMFRRGRDETNAHYAKANAP